MVDSGRLYVVWGYVAGKTLPPNVMLEHPVGENWIRITHDLPESFREIALPGLLEASPKGGTWVAGTRRRLRVHSHVAFQVPVRVADPDDAMREAQNVVLPRYLAALSALLGSPLYAAPVAFYPADEPYKWSPRLSEADAQVFRPGLLDAEEVDGDLFSGLLWAAEHDYTARRAVLEMSVANNYLYSATDDLADTRAILLTYFMVLHRIGGRVARFFPLKPTVEETSPPIEKLERSLAAALTIEAKVDAVRAAAQTLQALHDRGIKRRVTEAGKIIGLDDTAIREVGEFADLRNGLEHGEGLGHKPGETADWLPRAQHCAHTYLSAYLKWVSDRDLAAFD